MIRELALFGWFYQRRLRREIVEFNVEKGFKLAVLLTLGIAFILFDFFFFWRIISQVMGMTELGVLRISFIVRLLNLLFILFLGMVLFSNIITALSTFFLSLDLSLLRSSPLSFGSFFLHKFSTTFLASSWMILLFSLPVFFAYGVTFHSSSAFYMWLLPVLIPFLLIPAALGTMVTLLLMRFFPARRTHQVIASLGVFFGAGIVIVVRMLKPEEFIKPISAERLEIYDNLLRIPSNPLLPSTWASEAIMGLINNNNLVFFQNLVILWVTGLGLTYGCYLLMRWLYPFAYSRSQEGGTPNPYGKIKRSSTRWERPFSIVGPQMAGFFIKDIKSFFREATQWSQLFLLAAIVFIYLFNIRNIPVYSFFIANFAGFLNVGVAGFVLAALCARFVYPSVSLEGKAFWIAVSGPMNFRRFIIEKYLFHVVPLLFLGELLVIVSNRFLRVDSYMQYLTMTLMLLITMAIVGLGLGLGSIYPRFRVDNAAQIAFGAGGILYMIVALLYLLIVITLEAWPVYLHFQGLLRGTALTSTQSLLFHSVTVALSLVLAIIPPILGIRSLRRRELN